MLLEFYGTECPHCVRMAPLVEKLTKEEGIEVKRFEVWHNEDNARKMQKYAYGVCGGVPFFINTETNGVICGSVPYAELRAWAKGEESTMN